MFSWSSLSIHYFGELNLFSGIYYLIEGNYTRCSHQKWENQLFQFLPNSSFSWFPQPLRLESHIIITALCSLMSYIQLLITCFLCIISSHGFFPCSVGTTLVQVPVTLQSECCTNLPIVLSWASPLSICSAYYCQIRCPKKCLDRGTCHFLLRNFQGHHIVYEMKPQVCSVEKIHL